MGRTERGLPLLFSHDQQQIVGRATQVRLDQDRTLRADLRFREGEVWDMVRDGDLTDVSLGYHINEYEERDDGTIVATRWTPAEVSMVAVPADQNAGIGRSMETIMEKTAIDRDAILAEGVKAEANRRSAIDRLFNGEFADLHQRCIDEGMSLDASLDALAEARKAEPAQKPIGGFRAEQTDTRDLRTAIGDALTYRTNMLNPKNPQHAELYADLEKRVHGSEFRGMDMVSMAEWCLKQSGVNTRGIPRDQMVFEALQTRAVTGAINSLTTDFTNLLADQQNKALRLGWELAEETFGMWTQTSSAADFKTGSRVHLSQFDRLTATAENVAYPLGEPDDFAEPFTVQKFGARFSVSIEALTNDDLSGLSRVPGAMGRAASATVGDEVYSILTTNGNMSDTNALFDAANHANLVAAGAAPSADTIYAMRTSMALQTDNHATEPHTLGIRLKYIIVPLEHEKAARIAVESTTNPVVDFAQGVVNPVSSLGLVVVADHRLSAASSDVWYGAANTDTIEIVYLNGQQAPMVDSQPNFDRDGVEFRVRLFFDTLATDWRGLSSNDGVT